MANGSIGSSAYNKRDEVSIVRSAFLINLGQYRIIKFGGFDHRRYFGWRPGDALQKEGGVGGGVAGDFFAAGQNYVRRHDCVLIGQKLVCEPKSLYSEIKINS